LIKKVRNLFLFFLLLDQKEAKLKTKRCFCPQAFTLARRLVGLELLTTPVFDHPSMGGEFWWGALLPWESLAAPW
jgi:hypothetical protein